jgi:hypothetical protein
MFADYGMIVYLNTLGATVVTGTTPASQVAALFHGGPGLHPGRQLPPGEEAMTDEPETLTRTPDHLHLLIHDLTSMPGALSEVATVWRRARQSRTDLPLTLPLRLERSVRQLMEVTEVLRCSDPAQRPDAMLKIGEGIAALQRDFAAASAMTCGPGITPVGDAGLWGYLSAAVNQARLHALYLALQPTGNLHPASSGDAPVSAGAARSPLVFGRQ